MSIPIKPFISFLCSIVYVLLCPGNVRPGDWRRNMVQSILFNALEQNHVPPKQHNKKINFYKILHCIQHVLTKLNKLSHDKCHTADHNQIKYIIIIKKDKTMSMTNMDNVWKINNKDNKCLILPMVIKSIDC